MLKSKPCTFNDVLPSWSNELWPGRKSKIEANSAMNWLGDIDINLMSASPSFWRIMQSEKTVGVLSGHFGGLIDGHRAYRTRGLWVAPEIRRTGAAKLLMTSALEQAQREGCSLAWTFPRQSSMPFYESMGFSRVGQWIGADEPLAGEFGPNCYALVAL